MLRKNGETNSTPVFKNSLSPTESCEIGTGRHKGFNEAPTTEIADGRYIVRFARTTEEVDAALRLRFAVFNLELREGLESSYVTGRDEDRFDVVCHHLIAIEKETGAVVGTYRLQTSEMSRSSFGFYCAGEFRIEKLPHWVLDESLEIGRACVARDHRNTRVLFLLWKGLAAFTAQQRKRFLFGCCSLTSQDPAEGWKAAHLIGRGGFFHPELFVTPRTEFVCERKNAEVVNDADSRSQLPKLFLTYLRFGAKVCSDPAIDREFGTIDFFVIFDFEALGERYGQMFLA